MLVEPPFSAGLLDPARAFLRSPPIERADQRHSDRFLVLLVSVPGLNAAGGAVDMVHWALGCCFHSPALLSLHLLALAPMRSLGCSGRYSHWIPIPRFHFRVADLVHIWWLALQFQVCPK